MSSDPKYTSRRAYVVKLRSDAAPGDLRGRIEILLSCVQHDFASAHDLVELIERDLTAADHPAAPHPDGSATCR